MLKDIINICMSLYLGKIPTAPPPGKIQLYAYITDPKDIQAIDEQVLIC